LIRRKVQEKCASTQELIHKIREYKVGESNAVTPVEFRSTLVRFGIVLSQQLIDRLFLIFDSDRSGTIDFDEFAMWVMTSDFQPVRPEDEKAVLSRLEKLRIRIKECVDIKEHLFTHMKRRCSFLEFIFDINNKGIGLSEKEARDVFKYLDHNNAGFIDPMLLVHWAKTGETHRANTPRLKGDPSKHEAIHTICGTNHLQLARCFSHIVEGHDTRLSFEEFRQGLLNGGLGLNIVHVQDLFNAFGGRKGSVEMDSLFSALGNRSQKHSVEEQLNPKNVPPPEIAMSRADRKVRDALRSSFKSVKMELEKEMKKSESMFIDVDVFRQILNKFVMPITYEDFRWITQQLKSEDGGTKINVQYFLAKYGPQGNSSKDTTATEFFQDAQLASKSRSMTALPKATTTITADPDLKKIWHSVLRECHRHDKERNGTLDKKLFIELLRSANDTLPVHKKMHITKIINIADKYSKLSKSEVDYLSCFRKFLNDLAHTEEPAKNTNPFIIQGNQSTRSLKAQHPWEFDYQRNDTYAGVPRIPFFKNNTSQPKDIQQTTRPSTISGLPPLSPTVPSMDGTMTSFTQDFEMINKEAILKKYSSKTIAACYRCYEKLLPNWRALRQDLKKNQLVKEKNCVDAATFLQILEKYGLRISKKDLGYMIRTFRLSPTEDAVKYDDFLRVCIVSKSA